MTKTKCTNYESEEVVKNGKQSNGDAMLKIQELWEMFSRKLSKARPHKRRMKSKRIQDKIET